MTAALCESYFWSVIMLGNVHKLLGLIVTILQEVKIISKLKFREVKDFTWDHIAK